MFSTFLLSALVLPALVEGCTNSLPAGQQTITLNSTNGSLNQFNIYIPSGLASTQKVPTILGFHGYLDDMDIWEERGHWNDHCEVI
jgi:hypothetical protein